MAPPTTSRTTLELVKIVGPSGGDTYWRQLGLELIWGDVDVFVQRLEQALGAMGPSTSLVPGLSAEPNRVAE